MTDPIPTRRPLPAARRPSSPPRRRGFSVMELIVALAISAMLLSASLVALDASFKAYQRTTEEASTHAVSRLAMHRMLALIRTAAWVGPLPENPLDDERHSDEITVRTRDGRTVTIRLDGESDRLMLAVAAAGEGDESAEPDATEEFELLGGVSARTLADGSEVPPFRLQYEDGWRVVRVTVDLSIRPDAARAAAIDHAAGEEIRLVGSASPR
jgi:prepilin-type N-terminal cleavage/methylation domain-containing protein